MIRLSPMVLLLAAFVVTAPGRGAVAALEEPSLAGSWTLNRALSQFPREVGFGMDMVAPGGARSGDRGGRDTVTRVYEPAKPGEPGQPFVPASADRAAAPAMAQQPDAELKGLTSLGVVVEDLDPAATTCGMRQDTLETMVTKSLTDAGLKVVRNTDDDTYLYVHVTTTAMTTGFCFSRYDAFLYTHTTATLSYGTAPVLVQVSLLHDGGIAGGGASVHAEAVARNLKQYVDSFAAKIRKANK